MTPGGPAKPRRCATRCSASSACCRIRWRRCGVAAGAIWRGWPASAHKQRALLESDELVDEAPATVYAKLLDQGIYLGSVSTMYRILAEHNEVRERRRQATHPAHKKPELIATRPNEIWSMDRRSGPTTTSTSSWTSTAAPRWAGCWPEPSGPSSPSD